MSADSALNGGPKEMGYESGMTALPAADNTAAKAPEDKADTLTVHMNSVHLGEEEVDTGKNLQPAPAPNAYVGKRNFIHQLMDVALMMANVSQLKALLASENNKYYYLLLTFICMSIGLQVIFTICMLVIWSVEKTLEEQSKPEILPKEPGPQIERKKWLAQWLDRSGSILVLFIIVSNVFIAGFGVES
ncbi:ninjurin-2-like [Mercenaria mercenaria]|uniref:ninjurin-2-like n=1 Tax=Mercenaria mercenaria TaxID=6596 RepID=UPI00234F3F12|nr:ninjurin-2-like [Mercenaria mercenaria]